MSTTYFLFRASAGRAKSSSAPKQRLRTHCRMSRSISRRLRKKPNIFVGFVCALVLAVFCWDVVFSSPFLYAIFDVLRPDRHVYLNSDASQSGHLLASPLKHLQGTGTKGLNVYTDISAEENMEKSADSKSSGPPSYLPLAQHLKYANYTRSRISLRDMVFGAQKRTYPDLEPTNNLDLLNCKQCSLNSKALGRNTLHFDHRLQLARLAVQLVTFYNLSSMLVLPCANEIHWILPLNAAIRKFNPRFETHCAVSNVKTVVELMTKYNRNLLTGFHFTVYEPKSHGELPKVDVMFTWRGLEQYDLELIQEVFKEAVKAKITYILVGNSPGYENAKVVETGIGTFSVKRPNVSGLNVRAYPFGFSEAVRVFSLVGRQLLFYNTSNMRDEW